MAKLNMTTEQSAYMLTQGESQPSSLDGRSASTKINPVQYGAQSARQQKTLTAPSTRSLRKPSTNILATAQQEMELKAGMFNDLKRNLQALGLLTVKRAASTREMVLVISPRLEALMRGSNE